MTRFVRDQGGYEPEGNARGTPRRGWEDAFLAAGSSAQDELLLDAMPSNEFDRAEWEW